MNERPYRSWVEVSRAQIAANFQAIRKVAGANVEVMPVVKADAYRHGAIEVSRTLEREGARWLAVSNTEEGVALREAGIQTRILVMADFLPFTREALLANGLTPVIHSLEDIAELDRLAAARGEKCRYHLKLDTGMGRLGVRTSAGAIGEAILAARHTEFEGLMTHFASSSNYQTSQTDEQLALFDEVAQGLERAGIHAEVDASVQHDPRRIRTAQRLARDDTARACALWLRFSSARPRTGQNSGGQTRTHVAGDGFIGEGRSRRSADRLRRNVPRASSYASSGSGGGLRGWRSTPLVRPRQRDRKRETGAHPGCRFDGFDLYRYKPVSGDEGWGRGDAAWIGRERCN